jgi:uncharacterized protein (TIGR02271 family)
MPRHYDYTGCTVRSSDGEKLGKVSSSDADTLIIEKGFFFPKEYAIGTEEVIATQDDEIWVRLTKDELKSIGELSERRRGKVQGSYASGYVGETVRSADGEKLGKVERFDGNTLIIEKGIFFPKEYAVGTEEITGFRDGDLWIRLTRDELISVGELEERRRAYGERGQYRYGTTGYEGERGGFGAGATHTEEARVPLYEEELGVQKNVHEAGRVRIHKDVVTEEREVRVPVTREEIRVEHVPADERAAAPGDASFEEDTVEVPLHREHVQVTKRPVLKDEVRITKDHVEDEERVTGRVRKEVAHVDDDDVEDVEEIPARDWDNPRHR